MFLLLLAEKVKKDFKMFNLLKWARTQMPKIVVPIAEKKVKQEIISSIEETMDEYTVKISREMTQKTTLYALWSVVGIFLLCVPLFKSLFYVISFLMIGFAFYFLAQFFNTLRKIYLFIDHFDKNISDLIETKLQSVQGDGIKKTGLLLSGYNNKEAIENFCISYFVRSLIKRIKTRKAHVIVRLTAYTVAVLLFKEILVKILTLS